MWRDRAANPQQVEYILSIDQDDETRFDLRLGEVSRGFGMFALVDNANQGSAQAWDFGAKFTRGELLIQAQDDVEPPKLWDAALLEWLEGANTDPNYWRKVQTVVAVRDGYRKDALLCTAICNRLRYRKQGHFICPAYLSVFSDDDFTIRAIADDKAGTCMLVQTDLVFWHHNPYHTGAPRDATLLRENSEEAYRMGREVFNERNRLLLNQGLKTW